MLFNNKLNPDNISVTGNKCSKKNIIRINTVRSNQKQLLPWGDSVEEGETKRDGTSGGLGIMHSGLETPSYE